MRHSGGERYRIRPGGGVGGTLTVPGDKSISHRALMLGALAEGDTHISGFLAGEDCLATVRALQGLGVQIEGPREAQVLVRGVGAHGLAAPRSPLDMGNAGTAMRLMMGLLAPQRFDSTLIGDESLMRRPMERVAVPLQMMGARIQTQQGRPPVLIRGTPHLRAIHYSLPVASAQVKSAILLAGLAASGRTHLTEPAPSRDHTERMLGAFGVQLSHEGRAIAMEGGQTLHGITVPEALIPASIDEFPVFFIAAACASGETLVRGALELRVKESDRLAAMAAGLGELGVEHQLLPDGLWLRGAEALGGGTIDSRGDHRIAMAFAVAALRARAPIEIRDVANVATSFPGFVGTARAAGLDLEAL